MITMKCPYCQKELEVVAMSEIDWINKDDTVAEMLCYAYCRTCDEEFNFIKRYAKVEEKDLEEM